MSDEPKPDAPEYATPSEPADQTPSPEREGKPRKLARTRAHVKAKNATAPAAVAPPEKRTPRKRLVAGHSDVPVAGLSDIQVAGHSDVPVLGRTKPTRSTPSKAKTPRTPKRPQASATVPAITPASSTDCFLTDHDVYLFREGTHRRLYEKLGAHPAERDGVAGTYFAVWAPSAIRVSLIGDFNDWDERSHPMNARGDSGLWEGFFPDVARGTMYKYHIESGYNGYVVDKTDPFGFTHQVAPETASITWDLSYQWGDQEWMELRKGRNSINAPMSIYEVHLGSWMRDEAGRSLSYREIAPELVRHVKRSGFTHVELLPIMEHPFFGSWGYQVTGFFAPTSRFGTPQDFMYFVDYLHREGIGVILDWVPSHFPTDEHGLGYFDGTHLYEHADPRQGYHPDWKSAIFNYGRNEVRAFLISSALFWLDLYHADGIRVDAVASMLYLDYSRKAGEWIPNRYGGRDNLEAIHFLRQLNEACYEAHPDIQMIAEESTAWPMVSRPTYVGGLGFGLKWDMGWMHDTLKYFANDPVFRKFHHDQITFRAVYAFSESFLLPLSHDEVVHGKGSLINKMPGDEWKKFANLRLLFAYMIATPAKKLIFMGGEIGQRREWNHDGSIDWFLLGEERHRGLLDTVAQLNQLYREIPALHELDTIASGFEWIDGSDVENSVIIFLRRADSEDRLILCAFNFTPNPRYDYRVGVPRGGFWTEILNTDATTYGGSGVGNMGGIEAAPYPSHGRDQSIVLTLPPLAAIYLESPAPPALVPLVSSSDYEATLDDLVAETENDV